MSLKYDHDLFLELRKLAVTDEKNLVEGGIYYTNSWSYPWKFRLIRVVSHNEMRRMKNEAPTDDEYLKGTRWLYFENLTNESSFSQFGSLGDFNIGTSYNAWLIFDNEEYYRKSLDLRVTVEPEQYECMSYDDYY